MSERLFHPNHEMRLLTTFSHVDNVVTQAVSRLKPVSTPSPFSEFVADANLLQQKMAADDLEALRVAMRRFLATHQIPIPKASMSTVRNCSTACLYAGVAVEELRGRFMRAYGDLSPVAASELERLVTELAALLQTMNDHLAAATSAPEGSNPGPTAADGEGSSHTPS